jgi:septal ring factor EnvC (AmiA/AmiB activator)
MGHTILPFTWQYRKEKAYFASFRRALLLAEDKRTFDDLWNRAEFHLPAAEMASHPLPVATILMMMNLEQHKAIQLLENKVKDQVQQIEHLEKSLKKSQAQIVSLKGELETIEAEIEARLGAFREEMLAIKFPEYLDAA